MNINPQRAQALFLAAMEILDPAARQELLHRECADDAALLQRVEALLSAHFATGGFELDPSRPVIAETIDEPAAAKPNAILAGRYKLIESIGEGGMGSVWVAEQREPVRRKVAVKFIKAGMDSKSVLARFEAERQALAMMDHPNIAKVFDGGMTEQGRPFFVMEYVKGMPLTDYCDQARLTLKERLNLFTPICQAVQHAHQKGIIHRDLKPSNILICLYDGKPVPKVIDFGLAKAVHQALTDKSLHTAHGVMVGTPLYMSPEQAEHNNLDVDTRTDIYSLGVILYELLTGSTPLEREQLKEAAFNEVLRLIKEVEPQKPSTRLSSSVRLPSIAAQRNIDPNQLKKSVVGDLDWIVMKAIDKERSRRYETANGLARDVERFLNDEAVEACPPNTAYRLKKMLRRNKGPFLAASLVLLSLLVGIAGTTYGLFRANHFAESEGLAKLEAQRKTLLALDAGAAEKIAKEQAQTRLTQIEKGNTILTSIFDDLDLFEVKEGTKKLEEILAKRLVKAAEQLEGESVGDPLVVAGLQIKLGTTLISLGYSEDAITLFQKVLETRSRLLGADHLDTLESKYRLGLGFMFAGKPDKALPLLEETLNQLKIKLGDDHPKTISALGSLASAYRALGKLDQAIPLLEETLSRRKRILGTEDPDTISSMSDLANGYLSVGKIDLALPLYQESLNLMKVRLGADDPRTLVIMNQLSICYQYAGKLDLALPLIEESLKLKKIRLGTDHPSTLVSMNNLATVYIRAGKSDQALPLLKESHELQKIKHGIYHPDTIASMSNLASAYHDVGKLDLALPLYEESLKLMRIKLGDDHPQTLTCMNNLSAGYFALGKLDLAIPLCKETLRLSRKKNGDDHPETLNSMSNLATGYQAAKKLDLALPLFEESLSRKRGTLGDDNPKTLKSMLELTLLYDQLKQWDKSELLYREQLALAKTKSGVDSPVYSSALAVLGLNLLNQKKCTEAEPFVREALTIREKNEPDDWRTFNTQSLLGGTLLGQQKFADAEPLLLKGYEGMKQRESTIPPQGRTRIPEALDRLIDLYTQMENPDEAKKWQAERDMYPNTSPQ